MSLNRPECELENSSGWFFTNPRDPDRMKALGKVKAVVLLADFPDYPAG